MRILMDTWARILSGGVYMLPIFAVSAVMLSLILYRLLIVWAAMRELRHILDTGVYALRPDSLWTASSAEYLQARSGRPRIDAELREEMVNSWLSRLNTGGKPVLLCASLATMLGLLGTVSGIILSFESMHAFGAGTTKSMATGISQALITTQSGLLAGVTGVISGNLLNRATLRLRLRLRRFCMLLEHSIPPSGGSAP